MHSTIQYEKNDTFLVFITLRIAYYFTFLNYVKVTKKTLSICTVLIHMARRRRVPKKLGPKRIVGEGNALRIKQTEFCPECDRRLKVSSTQKPHTVTSMICDNVDGHKKGKIYLWPSENIEILTS